MRAVLFDMDGTLVDSSRGVESEWARWGDARGIDAARLHDLRHGLRTADVVAALCPQLDDAAAEAEAIEGRMLTVPGEPVPGVIALYRATAPSRRAIVTSATSTMARGRLAEQRLELPDVLVTGGDVEHGKPDPAPYLLGARRIGADPADCLVVEDSPAGIASGHAAGMCVLAVLTTHPADELADADAVVAPDRASAAAKEPRLVSTVFTIGYEKLQPGALVAELEAAGVRRLIDVRFRPQSRRPGMSKTRLGALLGEHGIAYEHRRSLGTPADLRWLYKHNRVADGRAGFITHLEDTASDELDALARELRDGPPTALMCLEADPGVCHRSVITDALRARDARLRVVDL